MERLKRISDVSGKVISKASEAMLIFMVILSAATGNSLHVAIFGTGLLVVNILRTEKNEHQKMH